MSNPYASPTPSSNPSTQNGSQHNPANTSTYTPQAQSPSYDQPAYGQQSAPQQPTYGQQSAPQQPAYGQQSAPQQPAYGQQSAPQQPTYGQQMYGVNPEVEKLRSNSTIVLILGILGIFFGLFGSIPAWIWGNSLLKRAQALGVPQDQMSNARIGKILGIIGTILQVVLIVLGVFFFIFIFYVAASNPDIWESDYSMLVGIL